MTCCNMHMLSDVLCSGNSVQQTYYEITEDECEQFSLVLGNITSDGIAAQNTERPQRDTIPTAYVTKTKQVFCCSLFPFSASIAPKMLNRKLWRTQFD